MSSVLILGSTDTTLAIADAVLKLGIDIAGIVTVGEHFSINYSAQSVKNSRYVDIPKWCETKKIKAIPFDTYRKVLSQIDFEKISLCLVAGWYHMVPTYFRDRFKHGCVGFHASLLPKLRGGAPLNWAILNGSNKTGVTMFQLGDGIDDGPFYGQEAFSIQPTANIGELIDMSTIACSSLVKNLLPGILNGDIAPRQQKGNPSYCLQRRPEDGQINWFHSAEEIDRLVRAVSRPYPGAHTELEGKKIILWRVEIPQTNTTVHGAPGQLFKVPGRDAPLVLTGEGWLAILDATYDNGYSAIETLLHSSQKHFSTVEP